ncbi:hypothetical protein EDB81DRAFT_900447 [Dactylonectria macrodidyma]|uniref:Uncharacterized protein n=1 Tax=Dactylonectria macrodidyma TaxID=307937 RepID=A0A9P9EPV3_9HYPO|nr:hypothetical protein EDB81DRAFT_900447 [Dactylonectria macrodidyma]
MNLDFSGRGAIALLELLVSMHILPAMVHIETATTLSIAVSLIATVIQTWALALQRDEQPEATAGDANHLSAIQSTMMQYLGLYLSVISATRSGLYAGPGRPSTFWVGAGLLFPLVAVVIYPSHSLLTQLFLFFGAVASNLVCVRLLQMELKNEIV